MKKKLFALSVLLFSFILAGCVQPFAPENNNAAKYTISGKIISKGAVPEDLLISDNQSNRSAYPDVPETIYYKVFAKDSGTGEVIDGSEEVGIYVITLPEGNYEITVQGYSDSSFTKPIFIGTKTVVVGDVPDATTNFDITVKPLTEAGNGSVALRFSVPDGVTEIKACWNTSSVQTISPAEKFTMLEDGGSATVVPSGSYEVTFYFYEGVKPVFAFTDIINVYPNLTTNCWVLTLSTSLNIIVNQKDVLVVPSELLDEYGRTSFYINQTGSDATGDGSFFKPYKTIAKAVEQIAGINNGKTTYNIILTSDLTADASETYETTVNTAGFQNIVVNIEKNLTVVIQGYGTQKKIDGKNLARSLYVDGTGVGTFTFDLTLKNLNIVNGKIAGDEAAGAGIYLKESLVSLENTNVSYNTIAYDGVHANGKGAGIYALNSIIFISSGNVSVNHNLSRESGVTSGTACGGGIYLDNSHIEITGTASITNNESLLHGAGVYIAPGKFEDDRNKYYYALMMNGGTISSNYTKTAGSNGGGIYCDSYNRMNIINGELTSNYAANNGGAFYLAEKSYATISDCIITENNSEEQGGAISVNNGSYLEINGGSISENYVSSSSGKGGGIALVGSTSVKEVLAVTGGFIQKNYIGDDPSVNSYDLYCGSYTCAAVSDSAYINHIYIENNTSAGSVSDSYVKICGNLVMNPLGTIHLVTQNSSVLQLIKNKTLTIKLLEAESGIDLSSEKLKFKLDSFLTSDLEISDAGYLVVKGSSATTPDPDTPSTSEGILMTSLYTDPEVLGTVPSSGVYTISTENDLKYLATVVNSDTEVDLTQCEFKLINDIKLENDLVPIGKYSSTTSYNAFNGTINGNGHTISGITYTAESGAAAFIPYSTNGATIKGLTLKGQINGSATGRTAAFVATSKGKVTILNCVNEVNVTSGSGGAAGFVCYGSQLTETEVSEIRNCINRGEIKGTGGYIGGILGGIASGVRFNIENCGNSGNITALSIVGGIVGYDAGIINIHNCWHAGTITVTGTTGSSGCILGSYNSSPKSGQTITNCYYSVSSGASAVISKTNASFTITNYSIITHTSTGCLLQSDNSDVIIGLNDWITSADGGNDASYETYTQWFTDKNGYPSINGEGVVFETSDLYTDTSVVSVIPAKGATCSINSPDDLSYIQTLVNAGYELENVNISITDTISNFTGQLGSKNKPFSGIIDGNNHSILNLTYSQPDSAFIPYAKNATIKNLGITGSYSLSSQTDACGGLIGIAEGNIVIEHCQNNAMVQGSGYAGGIVGKLTGNGTVIIRNCANNVGITGTTISGGIVGYCDSTVDKLIIENCVNYQRISSSETTGTYVGGIIGKSEAASTVIINCVEHSGVDEQATNWGGIFGGVEGDSNVIEYCYYYGCTRACPASYTDYNKLYEYKYGGTDISFDEEVVFDGITYSKILDVLNAWVQKKVTEGNYSYSNWIFGSMAGPGIFEFSATGY